MNRRLPAEFDKLPMLTREQVAKILQVGVKKVDALREEGRLDWVDLGHKTIRIPRQSVLKLMRDFSV